VSRYTLEGEQRRAEGVAAAARLLNHQAVFLQRLHEAVHRRRRQVEGDGELADAEAPRTLQQERMRAARSMDWIIPRPFARGRLTSHYLLTPVQMGQIFDIDESQSMMSKSHPATRPSKNAGENHLRQLSEEETRA
jgi:hypothetical protein